MSKIKMSFSLIFTIFLVGILATSTFARSAYNLSVKALTTGGPGFTFTFDRSLVDTTQQTTTNFSLNVYSVDPATQALGTTAVYSEDFTGVTDTAKHTSANITTGITVGTVYDFVLTDKDSGKVVGEKFGVLTNGHNYRLAYTTVPGGSITYNNPDGTTVTLDIKGSGLANSNHTGADSAKKPNQQTHGFYQNNTNSCAVCHQTHTSDDSSGNLLMKDGVYSTCSACHDGTTGAYNAFQKADAKAVTSIAGTFNVTMDGPSGTHNGSLHDADGSLKVSAAPGGNANPSGTTQFGSSFDCASCHNPHGGGSSNENNLNQDPLGWGTVTYATSSNDAKNGKLFVSPTIYTPADLATTLKTKVAPYVFILNAAGVDLTTLDKTTTEYYYLNRDGYVSNTPILQTYRWQKGGYTPDFSLWLQEKGYPFKADTVLADGTGTDITRATGVTVVWKDGFAYGAPVANVVSASTKISLGVDVETTDNIKSLYDEADASYIPDSGVEFSKYCASCHIDYLSNTRKDNTGVYTLAHRHMTLADETNCIRCHFGHGSDATIMSDANDENYFAGAHVGNLDYFKDVNPSSALKRFTGMSACYACHGDGEQFLGNPNNGTDPATGLVTDKKVLGQPGTRGSYK
jgi:nitrate/TMAO reductase-like tetraheme cytochrome c subunit